MSSSLPNMKAKSKRAFRAALHEKQKGRCPICGKRMSLTAGERDPLYPTLDHIIPRGRGGSDTKDNMQLTHRRCNERKADSMPLEIAA